MPNRIDTAMHGMQCATLDPPSDRPTTNTGLEQLEPTHHPVLRLRQLTQHPVHADFSSFRLTRFAFGPRWGLNVNLAGGEMPIGA